MKKLPIILVLLLTAVWAYTCWYWYTCNIKGFCDDNSPASTSMIGENSEIEALNDREGSNIAATTSSQKLSADDVLFDPIPREEENSSTGSLTQDEETSTQTGSVEQANPEEEKEIQALVDGEKSVLCEKPLIGPIVYGGANNSGEVEKLESFLISRGESVSVDGKYGDDDFAAMKRFQLEYKAEVLDPWGIANPTGYVGRTTVKKINEIACQ